MLTVLHKKYNFKFLFVGIHQSVFGCFDLYLGSKEKTLFNLTNQLVVESNIVSHPYYRIWIFRMVTGCGNM